MALTPGSRLGVYEVRATIGAGGMGEVYRAHDTRLGRDVAIKILPDHFVCDGERLARFEREARTLASLNHPNIAHVYGMDDRALVMELVEGDDLSAVIDRSHGATPGLPLDEALPIARQVALALEAAHEAGIVHRDLKPANIRVRPDGVVKVLDFGLAKAMDPSGAASSGLANSPTITSPATELGVILGTAAYMSPEQARGKPVDRRADVWAFGVVLYEMLTGRRAFQGPEVSDVLASVLKDSIDLDALPGGTPTSIRRLLRRCLEKDRSLRLDSMAAARLELAEATAPGPEAAVAPVTTPPRAAGGSMTLAGAALVVGALVGVVAAFQWRQVGPDATARIVSFGIPAPEGTPVGWVAITPDGRTLVYEAGRVYVRPLDARDAQPLPGTDGARNLFLSADGHWVGFYAEGKIKKVALAGGDPLTIAEASSDSPGAGWGPGDTVLFSPGWNSALFSVPADGSAKPAPVSTVDSGNRELGHWSPQLLPDGKTVLFTIWMAGTGINDARIGLLDLTTGRHRALMPGASARYTKAGELLYFHAGEYHAVRFDATSLTTAGEPRRILPDARPQNPSGDRVRFGLADDGTLAYIAGALEPDVQLTWVSRAGARESVGWPPMAIGTSALSPDGRHVAATRSDGGTQAIWLYDLSRQTEEKLATPGSSFGPVWSPAGDFLVFTALVAGHYDTYQFSPADGRSHPIATDPYDQLAAAVSSDGTRALFWDYQSDGSQFLVSADVKKPDERLKLPWPADDLYRVRMSPDGRWWAFDAEVSGRREVIVRRADGTGAAVRVSKRGGQSVTWSPTSETLFYRRGDDLVEASYTASQGRFEAGREETLITVPGFELLGVAPDGRFLVAMKLAAQADEIRVVVNWASGLSSK